MKWRPRRSAEGATRKRVTRTELAPNAMSKGSICWCAEVKSIARRPRSRSRNSLERMARLRAASRMREWPSVASCARVSVNRAATTPAPSAMRETLWSTSCLRSSSCTSSSGMRDASRVSGREDGKKAAARRSTAGSILETSSKRESTAERQG
eukprot:6181722-Pleurochrysis_carterae.AAC.1